jgi:hypothetical protein
MKPSIKFNWVHEHLILYSSFSNQISLSIGLLPVNDILSNFNLYIFEPSQPIYDYFLSALTSSFHCYIFSIYFFDWFFFCIYIYILYFVFFLYRDPKMTYNKHNWDSYWYSKTKGCRSKTRWKCRNGSDWANCQGW